MVLGPRGATRTPGRRISAAELREKGVDEAFLAPAHCIDATVQIPTDDAEVSQSVTFVAGGVVNASADAVPVPQPQAPRDRQEHSGRRLAVEPAWSPGEMQAEYGVGYALLKAMGYHGGGPVPLKGVKRQDRVALQDNEDLVVDRSCLSTSKRARKQRSGGVTTMTLQLEAQWALGESDEGDLGRLEVTPAGCSEESEEEAEYAQGLSGRLQRAIVAELRRAQRRVPLSELMQRPRIWRMVLQHPGCGEASVGFLEGFIRRQLPQCRVRQSSTPSLLKLSRSASSMPWDRAHQEPVAFLRSGRAGDQDSSSDASDSCPDTPDPPGLNKQEEAEEEEEAVLVEPPAPQVITWRCHGCSRSFPTRVQLREHVLERLRARTTQDPTDLSAQFDPEHHDRSAVLKAAQDMILQRDASGGGSSIIWHCPACSWSSDPGCSFAALLEHADLSPVGLVAHRRLLSLISDIVVQDPSPLGCAGSQTWQPQHLARVFNLLAGERRSDEFHQLEEEVLGPIEADIFS